MAQYNGHTILQPSQYASYAAFKATVNGNGYDWDGSYGDQCWDLGQLLWGQYGLWLYTGTNSYVKNAWLENRNTNKYNQFDLIYRLTDVQPGDMIIFNGTSDAPTGHNAYADESYNGSGRIRCLGQNQGGTPYSGGGTWTNLANLNATLFLGAFRNKAWAGTPPTPTPPDIYGTIGKTKFPWTLYARQLRDKRMG